MFLYIDAGVVSFRLLSSVPGEINALRDIPVIEVMFKDGKRDEIVLKHYVALPHSTNMDQTRACNYLGHLKNEVDATVAVTGCVDTANPGGKMYITLLSKRSRYQKSFSMDFSGNFEPIQRSEVESTHSLVSRELASRNGNTFVEGDELGDKEEEAKASDTVVGGKNTVPFAIKVKIKVGVDASANDTITNQLGTTVDSWISKMITHLQAHYHHPTLRHRVNFEV